MMVHLGNNSPKSTDGGPMCTSILATGILTQYNNPAVQVPVLMAVSLDDVSEEAVYAVFISEFPSREGICQASKFNWGAR